MLSLASHVCSPFRDFKRLTVFARNVLSPLALVVFCLWLSQAAPVKADDGIKPTLKIGVLSFRSVEATQKRWQPLADYLNEQLPQYHFQLSILFYEEMNRVFAEAGIDYIFTNPQHFTELNNNNQLTPMLTLMPLAEGIPVTQFGGVIFTRAARNDINDLADVSRHKVAATFRQSFGGYLMQRWEVYKQGYDIKHTVFTGMPHDNVVKTVLSGSADVGFVRTGVLEAMVREGQLKWSDIKLINPIVPSRFPQVHSTALYPEWPFASMPHTSDDLSKRIAMALLQIAPDSNVAKQGQFYGFTPPGNYAPIEAVMLRLDVLPRQDIHLRDIYQRYPYTVLTGLIGFILLISLLAGYLVYSNRRLSHTSKERDQLNQSLQNLNADLEKSVRERTLALHESEQRFRHMFENHASPMLLIAPESGEIIDANLAAAEFYGYDANQLKAMNIHQINALPKEQIATERESAQQEARNYFVFPHMLANGEVRQVEVHSSPITINGEVRLFSIVHDISERFKAEERLNLHDTALDYAANAIAITDQKGVIIWANKAYSSLTGYQSDEVMGRCLYHPEHAEPSDKELYQQIQEVVRQGEVWHGILLQSRKNGDNYYEEVTITPVRDKDGLIRNFVAVLQDITERKQTEQQIQNLAFFDPLTNLPNRRLLIDRLETLMAQTKRNQLHGALLFLDLDHFKVLNDTHGHQLGDKLLIEVANRIKNCLRVGDTVARFGGDEFVILLTDLDQHAVKAAQQASHVAEKIRQSLNQPYFLPTDLKGTQVEHYSSASIGITIFCDHEKPIDDLLKWTDMAMYQAKASGRNEVRLFDPEMQTQLDARALLEQDLRKAIELQQLELYYQPQVDKNRRILGAEALLRWHHPEHGLVSPSHFIPLAEETGLILNLGEWVLETACQQLAEWRHDPKLCLIQLAVNISAKQLRQANFVDQIKHLIKHYKINPLMLKLELTESMLLSNINDSIEKMRALRLLGIQFSMDDFGTGFSSLAYLKQLPLSQIKIDQSFIRDITVDDMDAVMVQAIMTLGQSFQMSVIAEGVETQSQFDLLREYKCESFQGYLFSKPQPLAEFKKQVFGEASAGLVA